MAHVLSLLPLNADVAVKPRFVSKLMAKSILVSSVPVRSDDFSFFFPPQEVPCAMIHSEGEEWM